MSLLDKKTAGDLFRLMVFVLVTSFATGLLVVTIGNLSFGDKVEYHAEFVDATGVVPGDDIRIAGVKVGQVDKIALYQDKLAMVSFSVDSDQVIDTSTRAPQCPTM